MNFENVATLMLLLASLLLGPIHSVQAREEHMPVLPEHEVKAAHILKFKRFAEWPVEVLSQGQPMVIGVVGAHEVVRALDHLVAKRDASKQEVKVRQLQQGEELDGIHILYIGNDQALEMTDWLNRAQGKAILCVTDTGDIMPPGSMINFVSHEDRIRFDVSLTAAERSQIKLSAALLTVAREVYGGKS